MATQTIDISCPGCGAPVETSQSVCEFCNRPIVITTFNSVASMSTLELNKYASSYRKNLAEHPDDTKLNMSIAMCYLKLKLYDEAIAAFSKAVEENFDNSEAYFYAAVAQLKGKKAFVTPRANVDKAISYLNSANMIEPKGIYYYLLAYLKQDYYARKALRTSPSYREELAMAKQLGYSVTDANTLFSILEVQKPAELM